MDPERQKLIRDGEEVIQRLRGIENSDAFSEVAHRQLEALIKEVEKRVAEARSEEESSKS